MKKAIVFLGITSVFLLGGSYISAVQIDQDNTKTATFTLDPNKKGSIEVKATSLTFGKHAQSSTDIVAWATNNSTVTVTEFSGEKPGWTLKVKMSQFEDGDDTTKVAHGTSLFFPAVTPTTTTGGNAHLDTPETMKGDTGFIDNRLGVLVDDTNSDVILAHARKGKGYGEWILPYDKDSNVTKNRVQLKIPVGQRVGNYRATLTYTVEDVPSFP